MPMPGAVAPDDDAAGPPQEGLDPKLRGLTDLAPAEEVPPAAAAVGEVAFEHFAAAAADGAERAVAVAAAGPDPERPPQFGQDPKLLDCVNDGESEGAPPEAGDARVEATGEGEVEAPPPAASPQPQELPPPLPDNATATLNAEEAPPPVMPNASEERRSKNQTNAKAGGAVHNPKPNLTSSESLAEWNRIHSADAGPSYDFFKRSQEYRGDGNSNRKIPWRDSVAPPRVKKERKQPAKALPTTGSAFVVRAAATGEHALSSAGAASAGVEAYVAYAPKPGAVAKPPTGSAANQAQLLHVPRAQIHQKHGIPSHPSEPAATNTNFWLQEEEERFLLGLRLYGWGQWKRIQTIVQTRTNKQIKSHAQKREKVNPQIRFKYGKGKSRRGRISGKVLADDARAMAVAGGSMKDVASALLGNDAAAPSLDQAWKDVYGTNNGDGPNSRHRRHRGPRSGGAAGGPAAAEGRGEEAKRKEEEGRRAEVRERVLMELRAAQRARTGPPSPPRPPGRQPTEGAGARPAPAASVPAAPTRAAPPSPASRYSSTAVPVPGAATAAALPAQPLPAMPAPLVERAVPGTAAGPPAGAPVPSKRDDVTSLRPGMRVYSRSPSSDRWSPGTIYSAKIDPVRLAAGGGTRESLPLVFHVQHDDGGEDPNVPEERVMSREFYEDALREVEGHHAPRRPGGRTGGGLGQPHPLEGGTPVYTMWDDPGRPLEHGKWLPGTVNSHRPAGDDGAGGATGCLYHVLFDAEGERRDIPQGCVLDRTEYHELTKLKENSNVQPSGGVMYERSLELDPRRGEDEPPGPDGTPLRTLGELYDLFLGKGHGSNGVRQPQLAGSDHADGHSRGDVAVGRMRKRAAAGDVAGRGAGKRRVVALPEKVDV